ncbi:MAG: hypothetical protein FOGNACKC_05108 [Anaerolineae bacterium]|nr:hypothetical protein [Anaerolineae bacterium]
MTNSKVFKQIGAVLAGILLLAGAFLLLPARPGLAAPTGAPAFSTQTEALTQALSALVTTYQNSDGGFTSFSNGANVAPSNVDGTADAILAIAAAGYNPNIPYPGQLASPMDWMTRQITGVAQFAGSSSGGAAKVILALTAAGRDPQNFAGHNFVISLTHQLSPTGQFVGNFDTYGQSMSILALRAASQTVPLTVTQWLTGQQTAAGNFDDPDQTGVAIMALLASGVPTNATTIISATRYLSDTQLAGGGWRPAWDTVNPANPNSTALVYQALLALGENVGPGGPWDRGGQTPLDALLAEQNSAGLFQFFGSDSFYSSAQAIPALANRIYPFAPSQPAVAVDQTSGGELAYADPTGRVLTVTVPAGAVLTPTELILEPFAAPPTTTAAVSPTLFGFAGQVFSLRARQGGIDQPDFNFSQPVTLTLKYTNADIVGDEDSLQLFYWDGSQWASDGITVVARNPAANELVLTITHLTQFGLFGELALIYLPLVVAGS